MGEIGATLVVRVFMGPERINEQVFDFACSSIVYYRRMVKAIHLIKHKFIKAILFWGFSENRLKYFLIIIFC